MLGQVGELGAPAPPHVEDQEAEPEVTGANCRLLATQLTRRVVPVSERHILLSFLRHGT